VGPSETYAPNQLPSGTVLVNHNERQDPSSTVVVNPGIFGTTAYRQDPGGTTVVIPGGTVQTSGAAQAGEDFAAALRSNAPAETSGWGFDQTCSTLLGFYRRTPVDWSHLICLFCCSKPMLSSWPGREGRVGGGDP